MMRRPCCGADGKMVDRRSNPAYACAKHRFITLSQSVKSNKRSIMATIQWRTEINPLTTPQSYRILFMPRNSAGIEDIAADIALR
jgi:hypothetical protein